MNRLHDGVADTFASSNAGSYVDGGSDDYLIGAMRKHCVLDKLSASVQ